MPTWYAVVSDKNIFDKNGKLEYTAGSVISYGTSIPSVGELVAKDCRAIDIGIFDISGPDFSELKWDAISQKLIQKTEIDKAAELL